MNESNIELRDKVEAAITSDPQLRNKRFRIHSDGDKICLTGQVNTYFEKQLFQEVIRRVNGVQEILNQLEVS